MAKFIEGKVLEQHRWSEGLLSLKVEAEPIAFEAGQFTKLALPVDGAMLARAYSFVNAPREGHYEFYYNIVPDGPLTRDARTVKTLLCDPARTAAVVVTLAEEMPVNEAIELEAKLTALGIVPQQLLVNQVFPRHFPPGTPVARVLDALVADEAGLAPPLAQLVAHAQLSRDRRALNDRYLAELRARAATKVDELPMLFAQTLGPDHVRQLGDRIAAI